MLVAHGFPAFFDGPGACFAARMLARTWRYWRSVHHYSEHPPPAPQGYLLVALRALLSRHFALPPVELTRAAAESTDLLERSRRHISIDVGHITR